MTSKAREALESAYRLLSNIDFDEDSDLDDMAAPVVQKIGQALAEPIRNCDVGTAEEQGTRLLADFETWRENANGKRLVDAIMAWTQMPYEKGDNNEQQQQTS